MEKVLVENNADGTTLITINRPEKRNAICAETAVLLQKAFREFEASTKQKTCVITGAGNDAFSGGADTSNFPELRDCIRPSNSDREADHFRGRRLVRRWRAGAVDDVRSHRRRRERQVRLSEVRMGFTGGLIAGLASRIPHKIAMEMILRCNTVDPQRAYNVGLCQQGGADRPAGAGGTRRWRAR